MLPEPLNTFKKKPVLALYVLGVLLLLAGAGLWWFKLSVNPERVFWGTLEQSLSTRAVTIDARQNSNGTDMHQVMQYSMGAQNMTHSVTTLQQGKTTIVNELVGTPEADYTRYLSVQTDQKGKNGQALNFSHILGVWAKGQSKGQLFSQGVLGVGLPLGGVAIPIGNFDSATRHKLIQEIKNDVVYQTTFTAVKKQTVSGRLQYVYDVSVQPVGYANLMQHFAQAVGLHDLDGLDPSSFKGQQALRMLLTVDVRARHVVTAQVVSTGDKQTYSSYDIPVSISVPKNAIGVQELQHRLSQLQ